MRPVQSTIEAEPHLTILNNLRVNKVEVIRVNTKEAVRSRVQTVKQGVTDQLFMHGFWRN